MIQGRLDKAITVFDKTWKLPLIILISGIFLSLVILLTAVFQSDEVFTLEGVFRVHSNNFHIQFVETLFLMLFLLSWLVSIPVSNKYNHIQSLLSHQQETLQNLSKFAENIGNGNFNSGHQFQFDNDLGKIMLNMQDRLIKNAERDKNEKWISKGRDIIGSILRENQRIENLSHKVLEAIVDYTQAIQGAIYISEGEKDDLKLKMKSCYAYNRRKFIESEFRIGEGLVGQAAYEQNYIHRTEIPEDYVSIKSGLLGDARPTAILIIPLMVDDHLEGALELAAFSEFTDLEIQFFQNISIIIARTIYNVKTNERTAGLLQESTEMTRELQVKKKQLEENALEMKKKQGLIEETNIKLEEKIEEVQNSQIRQHVLLENASEIITIFDQHMNVTYESPSVKNILGYQPEEISAASILSKLEPESRAAFRKMFNDLIRYPEDTISIEFTYKKKNGEKVYMEGIGRNMLNDPAIKGIIFNHRDITQRKIAEQEQIMRGKMQALSENSQDMILRFDLNGVCLYANPVVSKFLDITKEEINGVPFQHLEIEKSIKESWSTILEEVKGSGKILEKEIEFPMQGEIRTMLVNVIPEMNERKVLETVLVVSHDITERKRQEHIVKESNRKIKESINYAKRIQNSIIPAYEEIKKSARDAFMWYKPKDVVSGDFPWVVNRGEDVYFASVDCTGHGVPGAMMSLIGFLLLNDISKTKGIKPSEILDKLHLNVVRTLRQDENAANGSDGMDIALCRYSKKEGYLEFSGAHRPLYHVSGGELNEIKGDKFPIGGIQYRSGNFTNHRISIKSQDCIYIFSDGVTDQFGGPDKLKYGPRRLRKKLTEVYGMTMKEQGEKIQEELEEWTQDEKQLDDILLLGIKF